MGVLDVNVSLFMRGEGVWTIGEFDRCKGVCMEA